MLRPLPYLFTTGNPDLLNRVRQIMICGVFLIFLLMAMAPCVSGSEQSEMGWTEATDHAGFPPRDGQSAVVFNGKIWVIGGFGYNSRFFNDV
jgi:hypothetical protein